MLVISELTLALILDRFDDLNPTIAVCSLFRRSTMDVDYKQRISVRATWP